MKESTLAKITASIPAVISWPMTGRYQSHSRLVWARVYTQLSPKRFKDFWGADTAQ